MRSLHGFASKTDSSRSSAKFWEKPQPGSLARPIRFPKVVEFVKAHQAIWPVTPQCRVWEVSSSVFYAWLKRVPSKRRQADVVLGERIVALH